MKPNKEKVIKDSQVAIDKILCYGSTYVASQQYFKDVIYLLRHSKEIIPCKDCKHYDGDGTCLKIGISMLTGNWYCADGERKN